MVKSLGEKQQGILANAGEILSLIASGAAISRSALLAASGLSRVTVTQRLNALLSIGLVEETLRTLPSGGRPTRVLGINETAGFMLVADITSVNSGNNVNWFFQTLSDIPSRTAWVLNAPEGSLARTLKL